MKTIFFLLLVFFILIILQVSFLVYFPFWGVVPNYVFIVVILINLFNSRNGLLSIAAALIGGFYLDVFALNSNLFFGFYSLCSLLISLLIKLILMRYVRIPAAKRI